MRALHSFAAATVVAVLALSIMLIQPVRAGTISIHALDGTACSVSGFSPAQDSGRGQASEIGLINAAGATVMLADLLLVNWATPEQSEGVINLTIAIPASGPAAPIAARDLGFSTGNLLDYACERIRKGTEFEQATGGKGAVAPTHSGDGVRIAVAPEPNQLTYVLGGGAMSGVWQWRRLRRSRSSRRGVTQASI